MARDDSKKFGLREREREREEEEKKQKEQGPTVDQLGEYSHRAEVLIEQLDHLYNMYVSGAEKKAPLEKRQQLDSLILSLQRIYKPTPASTFKYNALVSRYQTHRDRWDKLMKDLESGKLKRSWK